MARAFVFGGASLAIACALAGCNVVAGLSDLTIDPATTTSIGGGGTGGSTGGTGGTAGTAGSTSTFSCSNGKLDAASGETDVDCGGVCAPCALTKMCSVATDCESRICRPDAGSADPTRKCQGVTKIVAGNAHVCALLTSTELFCWGSNTHGQLGTGDTNDAPIPTRVPLANVKEVAAGGPPEDGEKGHTCAIDGAGNLSCWGLNASGELGTGDFQETTLPPVAPALTGAKKVAAGAAFTCAIGSDDLAVCWGANLYNQLGDGTGNTSPTPVSVVKLDPSSEISAGALHACAVQMDGSVACWGNSDRGQTAADMLVPSTPVVVAPNIAGATALSAGNDFTCAIDGAGLSCWGDNLDGELTETVAVPATTKPSLIDVSGATDVSAGADGDADPNDARGGHTCAVIAGGKLACWGNNRHGQLGRGTTSEKEPTPAEVAGLDGVVEVAAGAEITCVRLENGAAACFGRNDHGQVGNGQKGEPVSSPVPVAWP
ncbi:MAG: hypothetical protein U0441_27105 [Polyangiaceae bacterium]